MAFRLRSLHIQHLRIARYDRIRPFLTYSFDCRQTSREYASSSSRANTSSDKAEMSSLASSQPPLRTTSVKRNRDIEESKKEKEAIFVTKVGALTNIALALSKGSVGYMLQSTALIADAVNSAGDLLTDIVVYLSITEARKAATDARPWGMGKAEPLGALAVGGLLIVTGAGIGYAAVNGIVEVLSTAAAIAAEQSEAADLLTSAFPAVVDSAADASAILAKSSEVHGEHGSRLVQYAALGVSSVSIIAKEALYHYTIQVGKRVNSDSVKANAWQHRSDAVVSCAVFVGLAGSMAGYPILDPTAGLLVSILIAAQGSKTCYDALRDLSDVPANQRETDALRLACLQVPGVLSVETLKARRSGPFLYVECTVGVPGNISASAAHRLAELARSEMMNLSAAGHRKVANAIVDVEPKGSAGLGERSPLWARDHESISEAVERSLLSLDNIIAVTEVQVYYRDDGRIALKVDVSMDPELSIKAAHRLAVLARMKIEKDLPGVATVDVDLELDEAYDGEYPISMTQTQLTQRTQQAAKLRIKEAKDKKEKTTTGSSGSSGSGSKGQQSISKDSSGSSQGVKVSKGNIMSGVSGGSDTSAKVKASETDWNTNDDNDDGSAKTVDRDSASTTASATTGSVSGTVPGVVRSHHHHVPPVVRVLSSPPEAVSADFQAEVTHAIMTLPSTSSSSSLLIHRDPHHYLTIPHVKSGMRTTADNLYDSVSYSHKVHTSSGSGSSGASSSGGTSGSGHEKYAHIYEHSHAAHAADHSHSHHDDDGHIHGQHDGDGDGDGEGDFDRDSNNIIEDEDGKGHSSTGADSNAAAGKTRRKDE